MEIETIVLIAGGVVLGIICLIVLTDLVAVFLIRRFLVRIVGKNVGSLVSKILTIALGTTLEEAKRKRIIDIEPNEPPQ